VGEVSKLPDGQVEQRAEGVRARLTAWLDHRTGYRRFLHHALYENIPGGARWRYVWGSTLIFTFSIQVITGLILWMAYSPSAQTAWESVYYIQYQMTLGWLVRGLHHFAAQAMIVLLVLHLMQVVIDAAYKAPREVNFWLGLVLMLIVLGLSLTGYLLPWDQKGYWATRVATNLVALVPFVGESLQKVVVGGDDYGHHTLTRFFALHAGILPGLLIAFLVAHLAVFRRHSITVKIPHRGKDQFFWPDQLLKDAVACLAVLAVILFFILRGAFSDHAGQPPGEYLGADLGAPADPAHEYSAARPEWYFLFLFQFLKFFGGSETREIIGAIVLPGLVVGVLFLMPIIGRWRLGHRFNVGYLSVLLVGIVLLTCMAIWDDQRAAVYAWWFEDQQKVNDFLGNNDDRIAAYGRSRVHIEAVEQAERDAERARELAGSRVRIPVEGAAWLLRNDPQQLFTEHCASCHHHVDAEGKGIALGTPTAPNLYGFASREWISKLLDADHIGGPQYFGNTTHRKGEMIRFIKGDDWAGLDAETREDVVIALSSQAKLESQQAADQRDAERIARGLDVLRDESMCGQCHTFEDLEVGGAPDLTRYGSREWMASFIANPADFRFYADNNDRMPEFCKAPILAEGNLLTPRQIVFIVDWLRGEWMEPEPQE